MPTLRTSCLVVMVSLIASPLASQVSYARAERYLPWHANKLVTGDSVDANWFEDGNRFWYRNKGAQGAEWWAVDPVRNTKAPLWDNARLAAAMSRARDSSYDPVKLPIRAFKFGDDGRDESRIEFTATKKRFTCDIHAYTCSAGDTVPSEVPFVKSPDKQWEAFVSRNNLWVRRAVGRDRPGAGPGWRQRPDLGRVQSHGRRQLVRDQRREGSDLVVGAGRLGAPVPPRHGRNPQGADHFRGLDGGRRGVGG